VFKKGIRPEWEDKVCRAGGFFVLKANYEDDKKLVEMWDILVQTLISGIIPHLDKICGVRLIDKFGNFKFEIWTTYHKAEDEQNIKPHAEILEALTKVFESVSTTATKERRILSDINIAFKKHGES